MIKYTPETLFRRQTEKSEKKFDFASPSLIFQEVKWKLFWREESGTLNSTYYFGGKRGGILIRSPLGMYEKCPCFVPNRFEGKARSHSKIRYPNGVYENPTVDIVHNIIFSCSRHYWCQRSPCVHSLLAAPCSLVYYLRPLLSQPQPSSTMAAAAAHRPSPGIISSLPTKL